MHGKKKYRKITSQNNSDLIDEIGTNSNCNNTVRSNSLTNTSVSQLSQLKSHKDSNIHNQDIENEHYSAHRIEFSIKKLGLYNYRCSFLI